MAEITHQPRKRRRNQDADVLAAIEEMANLELLPATRIHAKLIEQFGERAPASPRTTQDIVRALRVKDESEPWTVMSAKPGEVRLMLDVLAEVTRFTSGARTFLTRNEADAILLVNAGAPGLSPLETYHIARIYQQRQRTAVSTTDLDMLLAYKPWLGGDFERNYLEAIEEKRVPAPHFSMVMSLIGVTESFLFASTKLYPPSGIGDASHSDGGAPKADSKSRGTNARTKLARSRKGSQ